MAQREQGVTGLNVFSGILQEEFLRELRGREGYKRFDEMRRNSPIIGAMLYYHDMAVRKCSFNFANTLDPKAQDERIDFLNHARESLYHSWDEFVSEAFTCVPFGYSLFYVNYKRDENNNLVWDTFAPRAQNTVYKWLLNYEGQEMYDPNKRNGEILGFIQQAPPTYKAETLLMERLIHFRTRIERNNPEGISLLRNAWIPYYYAKNLQSVEAIGYERDLNGLPHVGMPQGANTNDDDVNSDINKAKEIVRNVRVDEQAGVVTPFGWTFDLLSGSGKGFADIGHTIERYESRMLMATLMQWIMLGQGSTGTYALSKDQTSIAEMIVNASADMFCQTFTKQEVVRILKLNGYDPTGIVLEHTPAGDTDISMFADFLQKVSDKITWDADDELWLRQLAGLPERSAEEIQQAQDERDAQKEAVRQSFLQRANDKQPREPIDSSNQDTPMMEQNTSFFAAGKPMNEYKRRQIEKQWNDAMALFLTKQKRRVLKAAKELRNVYPA